MPLLCFGSMLRLGSISAYAYTVTFDPQGGTVDPTTMAVTFDAAYGNLPSPDRPGYTFRGWWTGPGGTGELVAGNMKVTLTENRTLYATWEQHAPGLYMVIDLSGGTTAANYPVAYLDSAPAGGWTDEHKTTKLVMRKIPAGTFTMGSPEDELGRQSGETQHTVTLTRDFYIGVFEMTQRQWELVMGNRPSYFNNADYYQTRPVEQVSYYDIRENPANSDDPAVDWPNNSAVNATSFMGRLRAKTGLETFDLPTESQWEYACRAGTTTALNSGKNLTGRASCSNTAEVARYRYNGGSSYSPDCAPSAGTALTGSYLANAWGLYDMHGNAWEWCLDWYVGNLGAAAATDPRGAASGSYRTGRGGSWVGYAEHSRSASPYYGWPEGRNSGIGFRAACSVPRFCLTVAGGGGDGEHEIFTPVSVAADESPAGYSFGHWNAAPEGVDLGTNFNGNLPSTTVTMPDRDVTLTAVFDANVYTVTFDPQGGSVTPASRSVTFDSAYGTLPDPARHGYAFTGWRTAPGAAGTPVTGALIVTTPSDHALYASWAEDPILCAPEGNDAVSSPGSYDGFLYGDAAFGDTAATSVRGTLTLKVTDAAIGKLTVKALTQTATLSFSSAQWTSMDADGIGHVALSARGGETLNLHVSQDRIWGSLTGGKIGSEVLAIDGARNRFSSSADVDAQALLETFRGYYTVALPTADSLSLGSANAAPSGSGYLTLTVGNGGSAKIAGTLADGTRVSKSSRLIPFGRCGPQACVPLFIPLYSKKGWAGGLLWIDPAAKTIMTDRYLGWFIRWEKPGSGPDGFRALLDTCGGYYSSLQPLAAHYLLTAGTNAVPYRYAGGSAELQTAALPDGIGVTSQGGRLVITRGTRPALADGTYDYTAENSAMTTLSFALRTGIFKGKFSLYYDYTLNGRLIHKAVNAPYAGVLTPVRSADFAAQPAGQGYYLVPDNDPALTAYRLKRSYPVRLDAAP